MHQRGKHLLYIVMLLLAIASMLLVGGCVPQEGNGAEDTGDSSYFMIIFLVLIFVVFYFLMIRPQRKKQSEHKGLISELRKGDKVITIGGIYGEVDQVGEQDVTLKVEGGAKLRLTKSSIMGKQPEQSGPRF